MTEKDNLPEEYTDDILLSFLDKAKDGQDEVDYRMKLAAKIYHAMKAKGWNQTEFARQMDKQVSIVSRWMSGIHNFETDTLFQIGKKLDINLIDLSGAVYSSNEKKPIPVSASSAPYKMMLYNHHETCAFFEGDPSIKASDSLGGSQIEHLIKLDLNTPTFQIKTENSLVSK